MTTTNIVGPVVGLTGVFVVLAMALQGWSCQTKGEQMYKEKKDQDCAELCWPRQYKWIDHYCHCATEDGWARSGPEGKGVP